MNNRRNIFKSVMAACFGLLMFSSCTDNFEDINKNPLLPDDEMLGKDGVLNGTFLPTLQFAPIHTGTGGTDFVNDYQVTNNLTSDSWMGYMAPRDAKWPGRNLSQFYFDEGWTNGTFAAGISQIFSPWIQLKKLNYDVKNKNLEIWSIAQISKIMGLHRTTDKYGAIPYFNVGSGSFKVTYDSQEAIYKSFFTELEEAVNHLYAFSQATPIVPKASDVVYEGNALKWAKLGNSLMLRLAMRLRYVDADLSRTWAEKAMNHKAGMIETVADIAKLEYGAGFKTKNALFTIKGSYNDTRIGATIQCYLKGFADPRINSYFEGNTNIAVPPAIPPTGDAYNEAAKPNVEEFSPTYWFKASETAFLQAEAALVGYNTNGRKAKDLYEKGIRLSFEENGISDGVEQYLQGTTTPASFVDSKKPQYSATSPSNVTVAWNDGLPEEEKLEKIIVQKYLAIFPDGMEAWSEWRRTGYPKLIPANTNISNMGVITSDGHKDGVRCWPYPQKEMTENGVNVQDAITKYRGGANSANVNVWWDVKIKK
ncbi:SusD/RagB family nutrient-binding outer membrane lipoprotein [uncultured Bacteroides sp.]|jgi:hypothetical protein|uniref:SusD/RagB family nutrient-binding outer membrane lipoprotein n=1 Tax=uncultured Bacteroides sp. TaxID=162156 RepID=UPI0027DBAB61|nr:SusD/RagB family nutrient-binding outer membrane lipoprotein [uncultured Bacteroides sp.]